MRFFWNKKKVKKLISKKPQALDTYAFTFQQELNKKIEECLQESVNLVTPPIKGKITQGKLKHRGLKIVINYVTMGDTDVHSVNFYLEQRGKQVGLRYDVRWKVSIGK